jgi:hypothetical protein
MAASDQGRRSQRLDLQLPAMVDTGIYKKPVPFGGMGKPINKNGFSDHFTITMTITEVDYIGYQCDQAPRTFSHRFSTVNRPGESTRPPAARDRGHILAGRPSYRLAPLVNVLAAQAPSAHISVTPDARAHYALVTSHAP